MVFFLKSSSSLFWFAFLWDFLVSWLFFWLLLGFCLFIFVLNFDITSPLQNGDWSNLEATETGLI